MKKGKTILLFLVLLICAVGTAAYTFLIVEKRDKVAPVITMESELIEVSVSATSELMDGVSAVDDVDGDVSAALVVEGISDIRDDHTATITYAAFDRAGNVSKATRTLKYTDYKAPLFSVEAPLLFIDTSSVDVLSYIGAFDLLDGDISHRVKGTLVSETVNLSYPGVHTVDFRVTNTMGDTEHVQLYVDIVEAGTYNASVELVDYLIYLKQGDEFDAKDYMDFFKVGNTKYSLREREEGVSVFIDRYVNPAYENSGNVIINVATDSNVDTQTPGTYCVSYTVTMVRGSTYTGFVRLHVVVEE